MSLCRASKTTVAQRYGTMFKNLGLLPRADVEVIYSAKQIIIASSSSCRNTTDLF